MTRSEAAGRLRTARTALLSDHERSGADLRRELTELYDDWLAALLPAVDGVALVAVGGLGRAEPAPYSDLDLVLLHDGKSGIAEIADAVWYPVWDAGVALDHSVRTVDEAVQVSGQDARAALGLLDTRHIAGDRALSDTLRQAAFSAWRSGASRHLPELRRLGDVRSQGLGEVAFLLEPDLKESYGGIRDVHVLRALAAAQLVDLPSAAVRHGLTLMLDAREALQMQARRSTCRLVQQEQSPVADRLGFADADELLQAIAAGGRAISYELQTAWRAVDAELARRTPRWRPLRRRATRRPLADGVVAHGDGSGESVALALSAVPSWDAVLPLRVAAAAAVHDLPVAESTWRRLAAESPPLSTPWPRAAREAFIRLISAGRPMVAVTESMDQHGLWERIIPEWKTVRARPQRNPVHRWTVDRHLIETAADTVPLARSVQRPDLLALVAVLHDIGKGSPGDHTERGEELMRVLGPRMGLPPRDVDTLETLVRHHLLLPQVATRRDIDDPVTVDAVAEAVGRDPEVLRLLHALTVADAHATGPLAWSDWKARLVSGLVARVEGVLAGTPVPPPPTLSDRQRLAARLDRIAVLVGEATSGDAPGEPSGLGAEGGGAVAGDGVEVTIAAPDGPGLLSKTAGLLALHRLDVLSATVTTYGSSAVNVFTVAPRFGRVAEASLLRADLEAVLTGTLPLATRLADREREPERARTQVEPARVLWFDGDATDATVVEVRAADSPGLLYRLTAALDRCGINVRSARVSTLGTSVVDAFYVIGPEGDHVTDPELRRRVGTELLKAATTT